MDNDTMFEVENGWLFRGLDGKLYVCRYDSPAWPGWEVFEARIEWWSSVYDEDSNAND